MEIRGLTLYEPYATLVMLGEKEWETRSWPTRFRGLLAIHAAKEMPAANTRLIKQEPYQSTLLVGGDDWKPAEMWPFQLGSILGIVQLDQVLPTDRVSEHSLTSKEKAFGDFSEGRYMWRLTKRVWLPFHHPCRGNRRLWKLPQYGYNEYRTYGEYLIALWRLSYQGDEV